VGCNLDRWWRGLNLSDRRVGLACVAIILATLPVYIVFLMAAAGSLSELPDLGPPDSDTAGVPPSPTLPLLAPTRATTRMSPAEVVSRGEESTVVVGAIGPRGLSTGSGVVIDGERIVTNEHVVSRAVKVAVATQGREILDAEVLGLDRRRDLALLRVPGIQARPAVLGDSQGLEVLEDVVALGYPLLSRFEDMAITPAAGKVSKPLTRMDGDDLDYILTTANINRGHSGGPLFNLRAEVVGINVAYVLDRQQRVADFNLHIPINEVKAELAALAQGPRPALQPPPTLPPARAATPQEIVQNFYWQVNAREYRKAYEGFSPAFRRRYPYDEFESWFLNKRGIWVQQAEVQPGTGPTRVVVAYVMSTDVKGGQTVTAPWREQWRVVQEQGAWRLDDLLDTLAVPSPTPLPTATPWPTSASLLTNTARPSPMLPTTLAPAAQQRAAPPTLTPLPTRTASPTPRPAATRTPTPRATSTRIVSTRTPTPPPSTATPSGPRCESASGSVVGGVYFDIVSYTPRYEPSGELLVDGLVRNNCDRVLSATVRGQATDPRGSILGGGQVLVTDLAPRVPTRFRLSLGFVRGSPPITLRADLQ
jgi:S1-C subfamily serine protease